MRKPSPHDTGAQTVDAKPTLEQLGKEVFMYPVITLIALTLFTWIVTIWASNDEGERPNVVGKSEQSSDEHNHRKAA